MAQFECEICKEGFEQRSRYERHLASSHPQRAASAADVGKALAGIEFPANKRDLVAHASRSLAPDSSVVRLIKKLPPRAYRDAAEVGAALGEVKGPGRVRSSAEAARAEPPSRRGGRMAASAAPSAAAVAKLLGGIEFPKTKAGLRAYARRHRDQVDEPDEVLKRLAALPERSYRSMADVARALGSSVSRARRARAR